MLCGLLSAAIGTIGIVVPILPTVPFYLLAAFLLARGSVRFHAWFTQSRLYVKYLEDFHKRGGMTLKNKLMILIPVSLVLIIGIVMMKNPYLRGFLVFLIGVKYVYFFTRIKTLPVEKVNHD